MRPSLLPPRLDLDAATRSRLAADFDRFGREGLPANLDTYVLETYGLDVSSVYGGRPIRNPWGKGSGQLSMRTAQVEEAAAAGLGFVVLKTVIAEDGSGGQSMAAWAIKESRMVAETITGRSSGQTGWTVTWKGRGWWHSFDDYLQLVRETTRLGLVNGLVIAPSVKYHLPAPGESAWRTAEYEFTTRRILDAYREAGGELPMILEKDFSPTLAGSDLAAGREAIHGWLDTVPGLIRSAVPEGSVYVGLKLFNALDTDDFQLELLDACHRKGPTRADFLIYANRLFDPAREFDGHRGVAYGGPDLSDRNLRILGRFRASRPRECPPLEISATGDVSSGRIAVEYGLRGCSSFQIHTYFQLPSEAYPATAGSRIQRALHSLLFDPDHGFIAAALHVANRLGLRRDPIRWLDVVEVGRRSSGPDLDAVRREVGA